MESVNILLFLSFLLMFVQTAPVPGSSHHIHHRIHVPQKVKTVYHTKIIKVPEHHHYYHEKEKVVPLHVEKEKLVPVHIEKEKLVPVHIPYKEDHLYPPLSDEFEGYSGHEQHYDGTEHNILKKHAPTQHPERKKHRKLKKP